MRRSGFKHASMACALIWIGCNRSPTAGSEDIFVACMEDRGFEVASVDLTPGREDVQLEPHDQPLDAVIAAIDACETLAQGGTLVEVTGVDLQLDVDAVAGVVSDGGVVAMRVADGQTEWGVAGTAHGDGTPLTADSVFNIASSTKTYTATVIYRLEERGSLDTTAPLSTYLPELGYGPEVTVDALLAHTSGLPDYASSPAYLTSLLDEPDRVFTADELLDYAAGMQPTPAGQFAYANTGYVLLGMLIEQVTGTSLVDAYHDEILQPAGLSETAFVEPPDFPPGLVSAWVDPATLGLDPATEVPTMPVSAALSGCLADCGAVATASDLGAFFEALFDGTLLAPESLARMTQPGPDPGYARGLEIRPGVGGRVTYGHGGGGAGYTARVAIDPSTGDRVVLLANNDVVELSALFEAYRP